LTGFQFEARAIVFDLDGVLVDTMPRIRAAWGRWAVERGLSPAEVLSSIHMTAFELLERFAPNLDPAEEIRAIGAMLVQQESVVLGFDGSRELLGLLPAAMWAIVTSARREPAIRHLGQAGLPVPDVLISAEDTPRGKPDPAGYLLAASRLGVRPGDCVAIEDSPAGARAAAAAGMTVIGVATSHDAADLDAADAVVSSLAEIAVTLHPGEDVRRVSVRRKDWIEDLHDPA
jgi:sugar-phosphatase